MSANVVQLERMFRRGWDWSSREMAEFYRVESALIQAGLKIESDRGVSDEGDPWFAFCRPDDSEVIVHIARIGGIYILAGPSYDGIASGSDIGALVRDLVTRHPLIQMRGNNAGQASKIFLHPAALLIAVVATAFFKSTEARALTDEHKSAGDSRGGGVAARPDNGSALEIYKTVVMDAAQTAVILSAVAAALQIPSPLATEYDTPNAVASTSDLLDFAVLSPSSQSQHALSSLSGPAALEVHQFELVQDVHAQPNSIVLPAPLAHVGLAEALPLIAVLWDLPTNPSDTKTITNSGNAPAVPTGISPASVLVQSPILTFKMGLSNDANESLPVVQAAKISYTGPQGALETQTVSKPDQLPTGLISALKEAAHTTIEGQAAGVTNTTFANALFLTVTDHAAGSAPLASLDTTKVASATNGSSTVDTTKLDTTKLDTTKVDTTKPVDTHKLVDTTKPVSQPPSPAELSDASKSTTHTPADVTALLEDFFHHTPSWKMVNEGQGVVVYDVTAMINHASEVASVSFDFADGSTLSLVGLPASLPHLLVA